MFTVNRNPSEDDLRKFGWAMLIGFSVIGAIVYCAPWLKARDVAVLQWAGTGQQMAAVAVAALGLVLCVIGVAIPAAAKPVYVTWMSVTVPVGIFMSGVMLTVLFFVLLPVFSLIVRMGDPLRKKLHSGETYWEDYKPHEATIERLQRPF